MRLNVLLTGGSGFLGSFIAGNSPFNLTTLGRSTESDIICDLSIEIPKLKDFDLVIHAAGKAHIVPKTDSEKNEFHNVNVTGTENLLSALNFNIPKFFIFISSVAVYGKEMGLSISEDEPLEADDWYGKSKKAAEELVINWCKNNNVICSVIRLPLLVGPNAPGNLGAMINGIRKGYYFNIGKGRARKSMVLVDDVVALLPIIAPVGGIYNITDGYHPSFYELSTAIALRVNQRRPKSIPFIMVRMLAFIGDIFGRKFPINSNKLRKITQDLTFSDQKARNLLGWNPDKVLEKIKI